MLSNIEEYEKMLAAEGDHWWYKILHELTIGAIAKEFGERRDLKILDVGCGTGGLMIKLRELGYFHVEGFDLDTFAISKCEERRLKVRVGDMREISQIVSWRTHDVVISNDNLYFLKGTEKEEYFRSIFEIMNFGGIFICNSPVNSMYSGIHDRAVGIEKRLTIKELHEISDEVGFKIIGKRSWPIFLSPVIFATRFIQRLRLRWLKNEKIESDISIPNNLINSILFMLCKVENKLFPNINIGSSYFLVLKKP